MNEIVGCQLHKCEDKLGQALQPPPARTWSAELLKTLPFLGALTRAEFTWLLPSIARRSVPIRSRILRAGEPPLGLYIIVSGRVRLVHHDREGRALIVETFGPKDFFGEMGLIDASECPVNVDAAENCELVFIPRQSVLECLNMSATGSMIMLSTCLERLRKAHGQMANFALTNVYSRVAQVLVTHGHEAQSEWHVDVGSEQIAAMVGASREMVSRVLRCMIEKRVVRRFKRKLIVIDREALSGPDAHKQRRLGHASV